MRYARQRLIPDYEGLDGLLENKKVAVIGTGGLGGLCSYMLVGSGVLDITIADDDVIEDSNLHRQVLFCEDDLGKSKAECAARELKKLDSRVKVRIFGRVNEENFADFCEGADLVMDLSDNVATRLLASKMCAKLRKDFIHCSVAASNGMLAAFKFSDPVSTLKYGCYACLAGEDAQPAFKGITGPYAGAMSCNAAMLAMDYFAGKDVFGKVWLFDMKNRSVRTMRLARDPNCRCCQDAVNPQKN